MQSILLFLLPSLSDVWEKLGTRMNDKGSVASAQQDIEGTCQKEIPDVTYRADVYTSDIPDLEIRSQLNNLQKMLFLLIFRQQKSFIFWEELHMRNSSPVFIQRVLNFVRKQFHKLNLTPKNICNYLDLSIFGNQYNSISIELTEDKPIDSDRMVIAEWKHIVQSLRFMLLLFVICYDIFELPKYDVPPFSCLHQMGLQRTETHRKSHITHNYFGLKNIFDLAKLQINHVHLRVSCHHQANIVTVEELILRTYN